MIQKAARVFFLTKVLVGFTAKNFTQKKPAGRAFCMLKKHMKTTNFETTNLVMRSKGVLLHAKKIIFSKLVYLVRFLKIRDTTKCLNSSKVLLLTKFGFRRMSTYIFFFVP